MKTTLSVGISHNSNLIVDAGLTVPQVNEHLAAFEDMPPVFATAYMVAFIEATCIEAMAAHLEENEHSVGIAIDVSHVAATPIGMEVTATVEITEVTDRIITFAVSASDQSGLIGKGVHKRAVIDLPKFLERVEAKRPN